VLWACRFRPRTTGRMASHAIKVFFTKFSFAVLWTVDLDG